MTNEYVNPWFERQVDVGGVKLFVRRYGKRGSRLVLIHGGPDWDQSYLSRQASMLGRSAQVVTFDMRGCGRSERVRGKDAYSTERVAGDTATLLDRLEWPSATLLGFSYGGRVALQFAETFGSRLDRLVLASTTAYEDFRAELEGWQSFRERSKQLPRQVREILSDRTLSNEECTRELALTTLPLDVGKLERLAPISEEISRIQFSGEWIRKWRAGHRLSSSPSVDYASTLRRLSVPVLILHGNLDMRFPVQVARRLDEAVPTSRLVEMEGVGHLAHLEDPQLWHDAVVRFLDTCEE